MIKNKPVFRSLSLITVAVTIFISAAYAQQEKADGDSTAIQAVLADISRLGANDSLYCELGYLHLQSEEWSKAGDYFQSALQLNSANYRAHNGLALSYYHKGESTFIPVEKIKQMLKLDNFTKAEKSFLRALDIKPDHKEALYYLASTYLLKHGDDNYQKAMRTFTELLEIDPLFKDADYMLGLAYLHAGDRYNAEKVFRKLAAENRSGAKARISLSNILMESGRPEEAVIMYYRGLERLTDRKMIDEIYAEIDVLLEQSEKAAYINADYNEKVRLIKKFWKGKDPTPTTPLNERFNVHYSRVNHARNNYPTLIPPYFDDRGKIYVKYGEPDARYMSEIYEEMIKPNESWSYEHSLGQGMVFDFVLEGHSYWEVPTLQDAIHAGTNRPYYDLYQERAHLSPTYQRLGISPDENKMIDFKAQKSMAHEQAPAERSFYEVEGRELPFFYNFARFRGESGKARMEIYYGVPRKHLQFTEDIAGRRSTLEYTLIVQDSNFTDVKRIRKTIPLYAQSSEDVSSGVFLYQENVALSPGRYRLGIRMENPESDSRNIYRHDITLDNFRKPGLSISDLELASSISVSMNKEAFVKNGLKVIPLPYNIINHQNPVALYFEIYDLSLNAFGMTDYSVSYRIGTVEDDRGGLEKTFSAIASIFGRSAKSSVSSSYRNSSENISTHEYLTLDLKNSKPGIVDIVITVTDNVIEEDVSRTVSILLKK